MAEAVFKRDLEVITYSYWQRVAAYNLRVGRGDEEVVSGNQIFLRHTNLGEQEGPFVPRIEGSFASRCVLCLLKLRLEFWVVLSYSCDTRLDEEEGENLQRNN